MVDFIVIGVNKRQVKMEEFEGDHTMQDVRDYWQQHYSYIGWDKDTKEDDEAISIDKKSPVSWLSVCDDDEDGDTKTLDYLEIRDGSVLQLWDSHTVG